MYKTETHLHTAEVSGCAQIKAAEMVKLYAERGYTTVFVTDHFADWTLRRFGEVCWKEKIRCFMKGYDRAKEAGKALGVEVLFAAEVTFDQGDNDYLVYGIDEQFLLENENMLSLGIEAFAPIAKERGFMIVQAHPYRDGYCYPTPEFVEGLEVINSNPRHDNFEEKAIACAKENGLRMTAGSDAHRVEDVAGAAVLTENKITSAEDFIETVRSGKYKLFKEVAE